MEGEEGAVQLSLWSHRSGCTALPIIISRSRVMCRRDMYCREEPHQFRCVPLCN